MVRATEPPPTQVSENPAASRISRAVHPVSNFVLVFAVRIRRQNSVSAPIRIEIVKTPTKRLTVTIGILIGMFLAALEATVVGTAMPTVISSLGGLELYSWVFSAYLLASTVTVPAWGKLSDLYGRRPLYLWAIAIFLLGSVLSGQAQSMTQLIAFRAIQGLGAGGLLPLAMTIAAELYTPVERARVQGYFSGVWGLASIVGPLLGGIITEQISWRWIFYLNIPFGLAAAVIIGTQFVDERIQGKRREIDIFGMLSFTVSVTLLMLLLVRTGETFALLAPTNLLLAAGSVVAMVVFIRAEWRAGEPLIPVDLLRHRVVYCAVINGFFSGMAIFGLISFIPLFVQGVMGTGATRAGSVLTPLLMGWVVFSIVGGRLLLWLHFRWVMLAGMLLMVAGFVKLTMMTSQTEISAVLWNVGLAGSGMGLVMITQLIAVQSSVARERLGIATSTAQFFRSIGGAVGVAIMGAVMARGMSTQIAAIGSSLGAGVDRGFQQLVDDPNAFLQPAIRDTVSPELVIAFQSMLAKSLHSVFIVGTVVSIIGLLSVALMPSAGLTSTPRQ